MSNYIENILTITGPKEAIDSIKQNAYEIIENTEIEDIDDIKTFFQYYRDVERIFSLNMLYPIPPCLKNVQNQPIDDISTRNISETGYPSSVEWCLNNWGTKGDVGRVKVIQSGDEHWILCFDSLQDPPLKAVRKISVDYPDLTFKLEYVDDYMDIPGIAIFSKGECKEYQDDSY